ncbi:conserved hypothetical protein [Culex quinquefasciatus]|uniref:Uncharacterized protein n=1 Tax=Culex quinquefasciatus TaxID=7176 RepID=B0X6F7_CULQU|nr:conserved hypothetical protein [Culex quinquefasciatus]|eukprot:XP_001865229.1 conserved hypothetical protein [Culex quinquefasciatus]
MSSAEELGLCRVCASPFEGSAMFRLFDEAVGPLALAEIFLQVAGIVADSRLPKSCCSRCRNRLQEVEDLRALCQESDRKLRKMVGIEVKEEEPDEELNGSGIEAIPKVEMIELPETYSYWDDAENRLSSSDNDSDPEKKRTSEPKQKLPKEAKIFQCAWCGRFFKTNHNLKEHETTHSSDKPLKCHICPKEFARRDYYKRHIKMHETEGKFKCNECDKAFHCNKRLENHVSVKHRGERPFQCTLCPKTYPSASSLYGHVQTFHEKKQPFKCDVCLRTFYSKYILDRHKMKHKGIKSSQCPHCDKKYESNNYLHQHIAERHPEKAGDISRCLYCGLGYTTDSHYRKHVAKKHPEHLAELDQLQQLVQPFRVLVRHVLPVVPVGVVSHATVRAPRHVRHRFRVSLGKVLLESESLFSNGSKSHSSSSDRELVSCFTMSSLESISCRHSSSTGSSCTIFLNFTSACWHNFRSSSTSSNFRLHSEQQLRGIPASTVIIGRSLTLARMKARARGLSASSNSAHIDVPSGGLAQTRHRSAARVAVILTAFQIRETDRAKLNCL